MINALNDRSWPKVISYKATNIGIGLFVSCYITPYLLVSCSTFLRFSLDCYIFSGCPVWFNLMNFNFPRFTEKEKSISFHWNKTLKITFGLSVSVCLSPRSNQMFLQELDIHYGSDFQALISSLSAHSKNSNSFKLSRIDEAPKYFVWFWICLADSSNSEMHN